MPKISLPTREVRSAGALSLKADADTASPQFDAVRQLGKNLESEADRINDTAIRQQQHVDKGSVAEYAADNALFSESLDATLTELANQPDKQIEAGTAAFAARKAELEEQM